MGISGIGSGNSWIQNWPGVDRTRATDAGSPRLPAPLKPLGQDLASGDLAAARNDYATVTSASGRALNGKDAGDFATQMSAIGSALDSGDVTAAKDAFQKLAQTVQSSGLHGHHHHHSGHSGRAQMGGTVTSADPNAPSAQDPFALSFAGLGQALDAGDIAGAKDAYAQLQSLLQSAPERKTALPIGVASPADPAGGVVDLQA